MTVKINIKGPIISNDEAWIYDLFDMDATSPRMVSDALEKANGEDVVISINSPGGYVDDGSEIYTELKNYPGNVEAQIVGMAASAASVIAMGADNLRISPTAEIMIHNASAIRMGDHRDMSKAAEMLKVTDRAIVNAYAIKSGKSVEELLNMMAEETWMGAEKALEYNLVDEVMFVEDGVKLTASAAGLNMIPQKVIDGMRNKAVNDKQKNDEPLTKETVEQMFNSFKEEIKNEWTPKDKPKDEEPDQEPVKNNGLARLFLNLK